MAKNSTVPYREYLMALERASGDKELGNLCCQRPDKVVALFRTHGDVTVIDIKPGAREEVLYKNAAFQRAVPRGYALVFIDGVCVHALYGLTKFGNLGDFHDSRAVSADSPAGGPFLTRVFYTKENGQCAHVSGFVHDGVRYLVVGSKNVHMALRLSHLEEDLAAHTEKCYMFAAKIARELLAQHYDLERIVAYCHTSGTTLCAEVHLNEHQHLVSYGAQSRFFFFAVTAKPTSPDAATTDAVTHPEELRHTLDALRLPGVSETRVATTMTEDTAHRLHFATARNCEGAVVVVLDASNRVACRYKVKNPEYVIWRAVRELLTRGDEVPTLAAAQTRLAALHTRHPEVRAHVSAEEFTRYCFEAQRFVAFLFTVHAAERASFRDKWVTLREEFEALPAAVKDTLLTSYITAVDDDGVDDGVDDVIDAAQSSSLPRPKKKKNIVMFVGFVGSGKTTLADALARLHNGTYIEQDMFYGPRAAQKYHDAIDREMRSPTTTWLFLSKCHHDLVTRRNVFKTLEATGQPYRVHVLVLLAGRYNAEDDAADADADADADMEAHDEEDVLAATTELCIARAIARGSAHRTLKHSSAAELRSIVSRTFAQHFVFPTRRESARICGIHTLDIREPIEAVLRRANAALQLPHVTDEAVRVVLAAISEQNAAMAAAAEAENDLRPVLYDCLRLPHACVLTSIRAHVPERAIELHAALVMQPLPRHITLAFYGGKVLGGAASPFASGATHTVELTSLRWNAKACAARVRLNDAAAALFRGVVPHVTIALAPGVPAVYSAELFALDASEDRDFDLTVVDFASPLAVDCVTQRVYREEEGGRRSKTSKGAASSARIKSSSSGICAGAGAGTGAGAGKDAVVVTIGAQEYQLSYELPEGRTIGTLEDHKEFLGALWADE